MTRPHYEQGPIHPQEVEGRLPVDKEKMLRFIDRYLSFPKREKDNF